MKKYFSFGLTALLVVAFFGVDAKNVTAQSNYQNTAQPNITMVSGKAAGSFEVDANGSTAITGTNLSGKVSSTKVYVGGMEAPVTQLGDNLIYATMPSNLKIGSSYDLVILNDKGVSNVVKIKVISSLSGQALVVSSAEIIGASATYLPGQTIKFSVRGIVSNGTIGGPAMGFNVQSYIETGDTRETVKVNGVYQSVNAIYNPNTALWDVTMTAPSDASRPYTVEAAFYCSNTNTDSGCREKQINKSFTFNVASGCSVNCGYPVSKPSITVLSPNGGEVWSQNGEYAVDWSYVGLNRDEIVSIGFMSSDGSVCWNGTSPVYHGSFHVIPSSTGCSNIGGKNLQKGGRFKIKLAISEGAHSTGRGVADESDKYFTVKSSSIDTKTDLIIKNVEMGTEPNIITLTLCMAGSKSIKDIKKTNSRVTGYPFYFIVYDQNGREHPVSSNKEWGAAGGIEEIKNGECSPVGIAIQDFQMSAFRSSGRVLVRLDANNLIEEKNEKNDFLFIRKNNAEPSITVLSPNGGEVINFDKGDGIVPITWETEKFGKLKVDIDLVDSNGYVVQNIAKKRSNTGMYRWKGGDTNLSLGRYKILVSSADKGPTAQDYSDSYFTIDSFNQTQFSVSVLYPNGGGTIDMSKDWSVSFAPVYGVKHWINLVDESKNHAYSINDIYNPNVYGEARDKQTITIKGGMFNHYNITSGNRFKIEICANNVCDKSDSYFAITNSNGLQSPEITSMSAVFGSVGTVLTLYGKNLAGFEGDLDAWIENSRGEVAYLPSYSSVYPKTNQITVKIGDRLCKQNNSYSGNPCVSYMTVAPGKYKIYTNPWGVMSNKVVFEVTSLSEEKQTILPQRETINSGDEIKIYFTTPKDTLSTKLYLSCPSGLSATWSGDVGGNISLCNQYTSFNSPTVSGMTIKFVNTTSSSKSAVPNFYIYKSDNPNYAVGVSSEIIVNPAQ